MEVEDGNGWILIIENDGKKFTVELLDPQVSSVHRDYWHSFNNHKHIYIIMHYTATTNVSNSYNYIIIMCFAY